MKKLLVFGLTLSLSISVFAQEFTTAWKTQFGFTPDKWYYDDNAKYVVGRDESQAEVLDGATGKSLWKLNFKEGLKVKSLERSIINWSEGVVLFYNKDGKKANGEKIVVDLATGKELWRTDSYAGTDADDNYHFAHCLASLTSNNSMIAFNNATKKFTGIDVHTGKVKWESEAYSTKELSKNIMIEEISGSEFAQVYIMDDVDLLNTKIMYMSIVTGEILKDDSRFTDASSNYEIASSKKIRIKKTIDKTSVKLVGSMKAMGFKIQFELKATGDVNWSKNFEGTAVRQLWKDRPYVKMDIQGDKLFVLSKNITVFDLKTGNQLWETPFDNCDASAGLRAKQEFGIAGWPLVQGNDVYYVDLKNDNCIKKVDAKTGNIIWKSEKIKSNDRIPNLMVVNGVLVAQFGGMINTQLYFPGSNGAPDVYKNENRFDGNFEVRGYDPASGKILWNTSALAEKLGDKFKDRISTIYGLNNKVVVASDKNLFCLEPKTGDVVYKTSLAASKLGDVFEVVPSEDFQTLNIFCDNGIASANAATGKLNYATKTDDILWKLPGTSTYSFQYGKNFFVWVNEKDFIGFDLAKGVVKGKMEDNTDPEMTADGNYILLKRKANVTKFAVNK